MGRVAKRVPVDFDWPIGKVWEGFLLPEDLEALSCEACAGYGATSARSWLSACSRMILMLSDDLRAQQRGQRMHPYFDEFSTEAHGTRPTGDILELTTGLAGREPGRIGHDTIDAHQATRTIIDAAGLDPNTWGICPACGGAGEIEKYPGQAADQEAWEPTEPPPGHGWQLWETTSEGSPISPVFASAELLANWCANNATYFGSERASYEEWLGLISGERLAMKQVAPGIVIM